MKQEYTEHAKSRMAQRGIRNPEVCIVLNYGDIQKDCGDGLYSCAISKKAANQILQDGFRPHLVDKARKIVTVISDDGRIITVLHKMSRKGHQYYREHRA